MTDDTILEILKESLSQLPEDELNSVVAAVKNEQNKRRSKRKKELLEKAIAALRDLQTVCFDDCITTVCDDCDYEVCLTPGEIADRLKEDINYW